MSSLLTTPTVAPGSPQVVYDDPFTLVMNRLWTLCFEQHEPLQVLLKPGNQIKRVLAKFRPDKPEVQDGDLPELDLQPTAWDTSTFFRSNKGAEISQLYEVLISTGNKDILTLNMVKFEVIRALSKLFQPEEDGGIPKNLGLPFVKRVELFGQTDSLTDTILKRKRAGWTGILTISVMMMLDRETVLWAETPQLLATPTDGT